MKPKAQKGWTGVDLDGTLAHYDHWRGVHHIGAPIPAMANRVKRWLKEGKDVRIFTARISWPGEEGKIARRYIEFWCHKHLGRVIPVTNEKDHEMILLYDDRARQVEMNTGRIIGDE